MKSVSTIRKTGLAAAAALVFTVGVLPNALAHRQVVTPPSKSAPVVDKPISNAWAQAHCNAAAPEVLGTDSVVGFAPYAALPCPPTPNPGGQIHPSK